MRMFMMRAFMMNWLRLAWLLVMMRPVVVLRSNFVFRGNTGRTLRIAGRSRLIFGSNAMRVFMMNWPRLAWLLVMMRPVVVLRSNFVLGGNTRRTLRIT